MAEGPAIDGDTDRWYRLSLTQADGVAIVGEVILLCILRTTTSLKQLPVVLEEVLQQDVFLFSLLVVVRPGATTDRAMDPREFQAAGHVGPRLIWIRGVRREQGLRAECCR